MRFRRAKLLKYYGLHVRHFHGKKPEPRNGLNINDLLRNSLNKQEAISYYFQRGHLPSPTLQGSSYTTQLSLQEVNENISSGTCILLTRSILPNILLRTKNDEHKQRVFRGSEHKCTYLYPDLGTNNGHKGKCRLE